MIDILRELAGNGVVRTGLVAVVITAAALVILRRFGPGRPFPTWLACLLVVTLSLAWAAFLAVGFAWAYGFGFAWH